MRGEACRDARKLESKNSSNPKKAGRGGGGVELEETIVCSKSKTATEVRFCCEMVERSYAFGTQQSRQSAHGRARVQAIDRFEEFCRPTRAEDTMRELVQFGL